METNSYLKRLANFLSALTDEERDDVLDFYSEYILDAGLTTDDEIIQKLGTPRQLARKILADYSIRAVNVSDDPGTSSETRSKRNIRMIWLIILALMASPIAIPLLIALVAVLFAFIVVIVAVIVATIVCIVAIAVAGVVSIIGGLMVLSSSVATSIFFIGLGLLAIGLVLIAAPIGYLVIKVLIEMAANFSRWLYQRFTRSHNHPQEV